MKNLIIALALIFFSLIYLFFLFKRNNKEIKNEIKNKNLNSWDISMALKGVIGGVLLLIIGIIIFINEINLKCFL